MPKPKTGFGAVVEDLKKQARIPVDPELFKTLPPAWHIGRLDFDGPYSWGKITEEDFHVLKGRITSLESMTWKELDGDREAHHSVRVDECSKAARDRATELKLIDEKIFSLHITGKRRVYGVRTGNVLSLLWWDPEHEVYPSAKKNT